MATQPDAGVMAAVLELNGSIQTIRLLEPLNSSAALSPPVWTSVGNLTQTLSIANTGDTMRLAWAAPNLETLSLREYSSGAAPSVVGSELPGGTQPVVLAPTPSGATALGYGYNQSKEFPRPSLLFAMSAYPIMVLMSWWAMGTTPTLDSANPDLRTAMEQVYGLQEVAALRTLEHARRWEKNTRHDFALVDMVTGLAQAGLNHPEKAIDSFRSGKALGRRAHAAAEYVAPRDSLVGASGSNRCPEGGCAAPSSTRGNGGKRRRRARGAGTGAARRSGPCAEATPGGAARDGRNSRPGRCLRGNGGGARDSCQGRLEPGARPPDVRGERRGTRARCRSIRARGQLAVWRRGPARAHGRCPLRLLKAALSWPYL